MKSIKDIIIDALLTEESHHKQWYLEQLLIKLGFDIDQVKEEVRKEGYVWDKGIPP